MRSVIPMMAWEHVSARRSAAALSVWPAARIWASRDERRARVSELVIGVSNHKENAMPEKPDPKKNESQDERIKKLEAAVAKIDERLAAVEKRCPPDDKEGSLGLGSI